MRAYGQDRRRRPTKEELQLLYARSDGFCQNCGGELGVDWHSSHLAAYTHGGATNPEEMEAWCPSCNLRLSSRDTEGVEGLILREWQAQALKPILEQLWTTGAATLHASPGAGKTLFTAAVFQRLHDAGIARRLLVFVPKLALVEQWVEALAAIGIHLDSRPRDGIIEHPDTVGAVVCYQSLSDRSAEAHATRIDQVPTLVTFDEVHHIAESAAWGKATQRMVGDVAGGTVRAAGVLNETGTLFRSNKAQRISTVRYERVMTGEGERWQAIADWSVPAADLIGIELRAPDLYAYGGQAKLIDLREETVITGDIADLSQPERNAAMRDAYKDRAWLRGYSAEAIRLLTAQLIAVNYETPLKLLFVANGQAEAQLAADALNEAAGQDFARLVISDEKQAARTLRQAKRERRPCAIVAVQMITEGFDCPDISTLAYAANKFAPLFVSQVIARPMRVTTLERAAGLMLPAQILIPDNPDLREAFAAALAHALHIVEDEDEKTCPRCGQRPCVCVKPPPPPRLPRWKLIDLEDPRLRSATVLTQDDGEVLADELAHYIAQCAGIGIPETYAPRVAVVSRRGRPVVRTYAQEAPQERPADPRSINLAHRAVLQKAAKWMAGYHVAHDDRYASVEVFQALANDAASPRIPRGGRDQASSQQLAAVAAWMIARVREHCQAHQEPLPLWAGGNDA